MSIERKRSNNEKFWLLRFWDWLLNLHSHEEALYPASPEKLPPKDPNCQPQGTIYRMLSSRPKLLAGNGGSTDSSLQVYHYCGVVFYKADTVYHYINPGLDIQVGDRVQVPVHIHGGTEMAEGMVVSSGEYLAACVPYPVAQTSLIAKKL